MSILEKKKSDPNRYNPLNSSIENSSIDNKK